MKYISLMNRKMLKFIAFGLFFAQFNFILGGAMIAQPGLSAVSDGQSVVLTWQTTSEDNLKNFVIERKPTEGEFVEIASLNPEEDKYYEYVDRTAYKTEEAVYVYRLKIVDNDGSVTYSGEASVLHNVSSVRRTWGSIKALFR